MSDRVEYICGDVRNESALNGLGKFDFVYSSFSMHHWKEPGESLRNLYRTVADNGILYIHDCRRVRWALLLPMDKGTKDSIRASFTPREIEGLMEELGIDNFEIRALFPFFIQSIIVRK